MGKRMKKILKEIIICITFLLSIPAVILLAILFFLSYGIEKIFGIVRKSLDGLFFKGLEFFNWMSGEWLGEEKKL